MAESRYYFVGDVMEIMEIKERKAYEIINELNKELKAMGKLTISGRVPKSYFHYRYDLTDNKPNKVQPIRIQCRKEGSRRYHITGSVPGVIQASIRANCAIARDQ